MSDSQKKSTEKKNQSELIKVDTPKSPEQKPLTFLNGEILGIGQSIGESQPPLEAMKARFNIVTSYKIDVLGRKVLELITPIQVQINKLLDKHGKKHEDGEYKGRVILKDDKPIYLSIEDEVTCNEEYEKLVTLESEFTMKSKIKISKYERETAIKVVDDVTGKISYSELKLQPNEIGALTPFFEFEGLELEEEL